MILYYTAEELLDMGTSDLSHCTPPNWAYMCNMFPDVCLQQV